MPRHWRASCPQSRRRRAHTPPPSDRRCAVPRVAARRARSDAWAARRPYRAERSPPGRRRKVPRMKADRLLVLLLLFVLLLLAVLLLFEVALEDFAGLVARQRVDEYNLARGLVASQVVAHVVLDLVLAQALAVAQHYERSQ